MGGVFIKIGQYMSSLNNIIPNEYVEVLSELTDNGKRFKYKSLFI